jgi:hypothetical protein
MPKKEKPQKKVSIPDTSEVAVDRRTEWRLELPLSALVEGDLPQGKKFKEKITLENISSKGAYFCLDSGVTVGSKLHLVIDVPKELTEGKKVKLYLGGLTIRLEEPIKGGKKQGVALRFDEEFSFISDEKKKK